MTRTRVGCGLRICLRGAAGVVATYSSCYAASPSPRARPGKGEPRSRTRRRVVAERAGAQGSPADSDVRKTVLEAAAQISRPLVQQLRRGC
jgi:hypothetical protein